MVCSYAISGKEKYKGCGLMIRSFFISPPPKIFYDLIKDVMMLDSVGTTKLLAATLYDKSVSSGPNS
jgi:hypothetical protein